MAALTAILVPTDFSEPACAAVRCAAGLAEPFGATLTLLHVASDLVSQSLTAGIDSSASDRLQQEFERAAAAKLKQALGQPPLNRTGMTSAVRVGDPYDEILRFALGHQIDLIVVGTHGRRGLAHMLLGSVTEHLVRTSPCPVLTVRACQHGVQAR